MAIHIVWGLLFSFLFASVEPSNRASLDLYYIPPSPPCRIVMMTAKLLGLNLNLKHVDIFKKEQFTPEFLRLNPLHTVPVLVDGDFVLSESRAIAAYLVSRYGKDDSLYPQQPQQRAIVDQRLYYDMGTLYQRFYELYMPILFSGASYDENKAKKLDEAISVLEIYLCENELAAGDHITIADLSLVATVSTIEAVRFDLSRYPKVQRWFEKCKCLIPDYKEINQDGADIYTQMISSNVFK